MLIKVGTWRFNKLGLHITRNCTIISTGCLIYMCRRPHKLKKIEYNKTMKQNCQGLTWLISLFKSLIHCHALLWHVFCNSHVQSAVNLGILPTFAYPLWKSDQKATRRTTSEKSLQIFLNLCKDSFFLQVYRMLRLQRLTSDGVNRDLREDGTVLGMLYPLPQPAHNLIDNQVSQKTN